jgi:hypothetical protein
MIYLLYVLVHTTTSGIRCILTAKQFRIGYDESAVLFFGSLPPCQNQDKYLLIDQIKACNEIQADQAVISLFKNWIIFFKYCEFLCSIIQNGCVRELVKRAVDEAIECALWQVHLQMLYDDLYENLTKETSSSLLCLHTEILEQDMRLYFYTLSD